MRLKYKFNQAFWKNSSNTPRKTEAVKINFLSYCMDKNADHMQESAFYDAKNLLYQSPESFTIRSWVS
jgi:hypothetical protein